MSKGGAQGHDGKSTEAAEPSSWELRTLDRQLWIPHGTKLGSLQVGDSCVAWSILGSLAVGPGSSPGA